MKSQCEGLESTVYTVAKRVLHDYAEYDLRRNHRFRGCYGEDEHRGIKANTAFLHKSLPIAVAQPYAKFVLEGKPLADHTLTDILNLCLTEDAISLLLDLSCNEYQFWRQARTLVTTSTVHLYEPTLLFTAEYVHVRLVEDRVRDCRESIVGLQNLMRVHNEPGQMKPRQAMQLLEEGILMSEARDVGDEHEVLIVHPWWKPVIRGRIIAAENDSHL
jgi:hypothetical protein